MDGKDLVGTVGLVKKTDGVAHLKRMAVKKEFRKRGLGDRFLETVLKFSKEHNIKTIYAGMVPENTKAIKFYKKHGFEENNFVPEGIVISDVPICLRLSL